MIINLYMKKSQYGWEVNYTFRNASNGEIVATANNKKR